MNKELVSQIVRWVLIVNLLTLTLLFAGIFYINRYEPILVQREFDDLRHQAQFYAAALGEGTLSTSNSGKAELSVRSIRLIRNMMGAVVARAQLFDASGKLIADTHQLPGIQIETLDPPSDRSNWTRQAFEGAVNWMITSSDNLELPEYNGIKVQKISDPSSNYLTEPLKDLLENNFVISPSKDRRDDRFRLGTTVPIRHGNTDVGGLRLIASSNRLDQELFGLYKEITKFFIAALVGVIFLSLILSLYLGSKIEEPVRRIKETLENTIAEVSHELRRPLTSMMSAVESAINAKDKERTKNMLSIIQHDVSRLNQLITDIVNSARIDAELEEKNSEPVDIGDILRVIVEVYSNELNDGQNLKLERKGIENTRLLVDGIEGRIAQVFENLVKNAISFSPTNGQIIINVDRKNEHIEIDISDEGPGIPGGSKDKIFDRFYLDRPDLKPGEVHSGVGLFLCKKIVEGVGGRITSSNRMDLDGKVIGANFNLILPIADNQRHSHFRA